MKIQGIAISPVIDLQNKINQISSSFWTSVLIGEMVILLFTLAFISFLLLHNKLP